MAYDLLRICSAAHSLQTNNQEEATVNRTHLSASVLLACLLGGPTANAVPVVYDFTGSGNLYTLGGVGYSPIASATEFSGWVSIDVNPSGPGGPDSHFDSTYEWAYDYNGWVQSDFFIDWGSGSFNPTAGPGMLSQSDNYAENGYASVYDQLFNRELYTSYDAASATSHVSHASLTRFTSDLSWLSSFSTFDTSVGMATGTGYFINRIQFDDYFYTSSGDYSGRTGVIELTSLTARTASVPEPGTLALLGLGLVGVWLARRRRAR
jgi:hypothetical protein